MYVAKELGVEKENSNLLLDIFNIYVSLKQKYKVPWKFRTYDDKSYWVHYTISNNYPYIEEMRKRIMPMLEMQKAKAALKEENKISLIMVDKL